MINGYFFVPFRLILSTIHIQEIATQAVSKPNIIIYPLSLSVQKLQLVDME